MFTRLSRRSVATVFPLIGLLVIALVIASAGPSTSTHAQDAPTATIPVETQVWLDLTATANAPAPGLELTATYQAAFNNAVATLTAQAAPSTPTLASLVTATSPATPTPADSGLAPGVPSATPEATEAVDASARLDLLKTDMNVVSGGTFLMGTTPEEGIAATDNCAFYGITCDPGWTTDAVPLHQVTLDSFDMEIYEVNLEQYVTFLNSLGPNSHLTGCRTQRCAYLNTESESSVIAFDGTTYSLLADDFYTDYPATNVTWYGAQAYCEALDRRLPTEAEWERAARGSEARLFPWGNTFNINFANSNQSANGGTMPVNAYPQALSPYGMYNLAGNVQEWVADWYDASYYARNSGGTVVNPFGPPTGLNKVVRGGSWDTAPLFLRSVHRRSENPLTGTSAIGFRCAADRVAPPTETTAPDTVPLEATPSPTTTG